MLTAELHSQTDLLNHSISAGNLQGGEGAVVVVYHRYKWTWVVEIFRPIGIGWVLRTEIFNFFLEIT